MWRIHIGAQPKANHQFCETSLFSLFQSETWWSRQIVGSPYCLQNLHWAFTSMDKETKERFTIPMVWNFCGIKTKGINRKSGTSLHIQVWIQQSGLFHTVKNFLFLFLKVCLNLNLLYPVKMIFPLLTVKLLLQTTTFHLLCYLHNYFHKMN